MKAAMKLGGRILGAVLVAIGLLALSTPAWANVTVNPAGISFGTVAVGATSSTASVTLTNNSSRHSVGINASLAPAQFSYQGSTTFTLKPRQVLTVGVSFSPTVAQAYNGVLSLVTSTGSTLSVSLSGSGSGAAPQPTAPKITLTVDPASSSLAAGAKQRFIATTHGGNNTGITWNASCGSFTSDGWYGYYTAPSTAGSCTVTGRLTADSTVSASVAVSVTGATPTTVMPSITNQPASRTVTAGQTAPFSVTASGDSISYQWKKNGAAISGATSSSYTTPATTMSDSGAQFTCTVSNSAGNITSNAAMLTVSAAALAPSITGQPASRTVTAGQTASFTVSVTGTAPFSYQWRKNGAAISGATSSSYTTPAATTADNGAPFTVVVSNAAGNVTSNPATLTVNAATLLLSMNPGSLSFGNVNVGNSASQQATLTNSGTGNITLSGLSFSGAGFSASGVSSGQLLTPGQTATVNVSFQPTASGSVNGSVTVSSNATPVAVTLSGSGVQQISHSALLSWTRSTSTVNGYLVYSSQVSGGPYTKLTASAVNLPSYTDSSVQNGNTYYYVVTALDANGMESSYSNQASAVIQ